MPEAHWPTVPRRGELSFSGCSSCLFSEHHGHFLVLAARSALFLATCRTEAASCTATLSSTAVTSPRWDTARTRKRDRTVPHGIPVNKVPSLPVKVLRVNANVNAGGHCTIDCMQLCGTSWQLVCCFPETAARGHAPRSRARGSPYFARTSHSEYQVPGSMRRPEQSLHVASSNVLLRTVER